MNRIPPLLPNRLAINGQLRQKRSYIPRNPRRFIIFHDVNIAKIYTTFGLSPGKRA
jgi:hypothetical protein